MTDETQDLGDITLQSVVAQQIDEAARIIYCFEEIGPPLIQRVIPTLRFLAEESGEPITLEFTSPGGADGVMFALADAINSIDVPVHLRAYGMLSSAGTILFGVCDERYVGEECQVLLHAFRDSDDAGWYDARELTQRLETSRISARRWATILARRTNQDILPYDDLLAIALGDAPDRRMVGAEVVGAGLADGLIGSPWGPPLKR